MAELRAALLSALLVLALGAGAASTEPDPGDRWRSEWNERIDQHEQLRDHPCGDFEFEPWAKAFLAGCEPAPDSRVEACEERLDWVTARAKQCRVWKNWLLRNHNRRSRRDGIPEPPTRVR